MVVNRDQYAHEHCSVEHWQFRRYNYSVIDCPSDHLRISVLSNPVGYQVAEASPCAEDLVVSKHSFLSLSLPFESVEAYPYFSCKRAPMLLDNLADCRG